MNSLIRFLAKFRVFNGDLDYHLVRAAMVIVFFFFGYQKWFPYEAQGLIPYISHGPLIFWMYPAFGVRGATFFLGVSEWLFGALLFAGFWNKKLGILGALGGCFSFIATSTIIPFFPDGWAASAGGFPAMTEHVAFLMKDLVLLAVSFYLLKEDVVRASELSTPSEVRQIWSRSKPQIANSARAVSNSSRVEARRPMTAFRRHCCPHGPRATRNEPPEMCGRITRGPGGQRRSASLR